MVDQSAPEDRRRPKILIPDNTPLTLLGSIEALDWLFVPGCEVWMTDMVIEEALRNPGDDKDQRSESRSYIRSWLHINRHRIKCVTTATGAKYQEEMAEYQWNLRNWKRAGKPADDEPRRPRWDDRGEDSILKSIKMAGSVLAIHESLVIIVDNRDAREALERKKADVDMMHTLTFLRWLAEDFRIAEAETAWQAIESA